MHRRANCSLAGIHVSGLQMLNSNIQSSKATVIQFVLSQLALKMSSSYFMHAVSRQRHCLTAELMTDWFSHSHSSTICILAKHQHLESSFHVHFLATLPIFCQWNILSKHFVPFFTFSQVFDQIDPILSSMISPIMGTTYLLTSQLHH